jgi:hypothetical protein
VITQEVVNENLEHALDNGYFLNAAEWSVLEIVGDLLIYSVDCENSSIEELTPFVKIWYDARLALSNQPEPS